MKKSFYVFPLKEENILFCSILIDLWQRKKNLHLEWERKLKVHHKGCENQYSNPFLNTITLGDIIKSKGWLKAKA